MFIEPPDSLCAPTSPRDSTVASVGSLNVLGSFKPFSYDSMALAWARSTLCAWPKFFFGLGPVKPGPGHERLSKGGACARVYIKGNEYGRFFVDSPPTLVWYIHVVDNSWSHSASWSY